MAIGLRDYPEPMGERTPERETMHIRLRCLGVDGHEVDVDFVDELGAGSAVGIVVVETILEQRIALAIEVGFGDVPVAPQECRDDFAVGHGVDVGGVLRHKGIYDLRIYDGRFIIIGGCKDIENLWITQYSVKNTCPFFFGGVSPIGRIRQIRRICQIGQMGQISQMSQICPIGPIRIIADKGRAL